MDKQQVIGKFSRDVLEVAQNTQYADCVDLILTTDRRVVQIYTWDTFLSIIEQGGFERI